jgi:hypothetical protein
MRIAAARRRCRSAAALACALAPLLDDGLELLGACRPSIISARLWELPPVWPRR